MVLLPLTNASHRPTSTLKLEYTASLPEYPETDPYGFTYVVYVGGQDSGTVSKLMHEVRLSKPACVVSSLRESANSNRFNITRKSYHHQNQSTVTFWMPK